MFRPVVFLTDFGYRDEFAGVCRVVIDRLSPGTRVIDLSHGIAPGDVRRGALALAAAVDPGPPSVFLAVVDPGVGTKRKSVVVKTKNGQFFVGPDNGSFGYVAQEFGVEAVREIDETVNRRPGTEWSHTFHGRDVYAYVAGKLAAGVITYEQVGPLLGTKVVELDLPKPVLKDGTVTGMIDSSRGHLGNTTCLIDRRTFDQLGIKEGELVVVTIRRGQKVVWEETVPYARTFGDVPVGKNLMFINSSGFVAMAVNQGNFANTYNIDSGREWTLAVRKK